MQSASALRAAALLQPLLRRNAQQSAGTLATICSLHTQSNPSVLLGNKPEEREQQQQQAVHGSSMGFAARNASSSSSSSSEITTGENSWSKFRAPYGTELKSSLGPAMYLMIGTFGFSMYVNDLIYQPPRVAAMLALMMLLMYVRRV